MPKKRLFNIEFGTILLLMVLNACTHKMESTMASAVAWEKMDASLRMEVRGSLEANSDTMMVLFAEVTKNDDTFVTDLEVIEVVVQSRSGVIWTISGTAQSIAKASHKPFIKRMELSQKRRTS